MPSETRDVAAFDGVSVSGALEVRIAAGLPRTVVVTADETLLARIGTEVRDGTLRIQVAGSYSSQGPGPRVLVATPTLRSVDAGGASRVTVDGVQAERLELEVEGASRLVASGSAARLDLRVAGAGYLRCTDIQAGDVSLDVSGASRVELSATGTLGGRVTGASNVSYRGGGASTVQSSGASWVSPVA